MVYLDSSVTTGPPGVVTYRVAFPSTFRATLGAYSVETYVSDCEKKSYKMIQTDTLAVGAHQLSDSHPDPNATEVTAAQGYKIWDALISACKRAGYLS
jgi:hypothetical protein